MDIFVLTEIFQDSRVIDIIARDIAKVAYLVFRRKAPHAQDWATRMAYVYSKFYYIFMIVSIPFRVPPPLYVHIKMSLNTVFYC